MVIGALRLTFATAPDPQGHGALAQKIKDHLWSKYKLSCGQLSSQGDCDIIVGCALVGADERNVRDRMQKILDHLRNWGEVNLNFDESEVIHFDDLEMERDMESDFEKYNP